jgi:hypothetical protein
VVRIYDGGPTHLRQLPGGIPVRHGSGTRLQGSRSFPVVRWSYCGAWPRLGCSGAAGPRWSRELRAAEATGSGLGFGAAATG